jgi:hypothetical protein
MAGFGSLPLRRHAPTIGLLNRVRGERPSEELGHQKHEEEQPKKRRCSPSWARLIAKVFQADPLVCKRCGGPLKVVAYITHTVAIRRILDHLGLSPPEKPPPDARRARTFRCVDGGQMGRARSCRHSHWLVEGLEGSEASHR